jgi:hemolysin activation/secretion protein
MTERHRRAIRGAAHAAAILLAWTTPHPAAAQQAARAPQPDIGQTERRFDALEADKRRAKNAAVPMPSVARPAVTADTKPMFRLAGVTVEGATLLSADQLAATYRSYLGKTVSQADLAAIAGRISDLYRTSGFHLSRAIVPPQDINAGRIRIQVIEGRIADIVVKGERTAQFGVRRLLDPAATEQVSRRATLERQLLLVNDLPGVRIADTGLQEIGTGSGRFRLTVQLETWTNYTALSIDNRGTAAVGPLQSYFASSFNSMLFGGDTLGVNLSTVPDAAQELGFGRLFYSAPLGIAGARIGASASYGEVRPGDDRKVIDTLDRSQSYELKGSIIPIRTREASLWLTAAAGLGEFYEDDLFGANYRDHLRTVSLTADYQAHDRLNGWNYLTMTVRQGLPILGASEKGASLLSRGDGSATFTKLAAFYTRYQPLSDVWSVKLSLAGQLVSNPLLASEEFYLASPFGRGYFGAEVSGDNGVGGSLELRYDQTLKNDVFKGYQLYAYVDHTTAWNFHSDGDVLSLSLIGVGARLYLANDFQLGVEGAYPLEYRTPFEQPHDARAFFYVSKVFKLCPGSAQMRCS